jgi:hypothetical protein
MKRSAEKERERQRCKWQRQKWKYTDRIRAWRREQSRLLTDYYVKRLIASWSSLSMKDITPEMVEMKRAQMILKRSGLAERRIRWESYIENKQPHHTTIPI